MTVEASFAEGDLRPDVAMKSDTFQVIQPDGKKLPLVPAAVLKDAKRKRLTFRTLSDTHRHTRKKNILGP